MRKLLSHWQEIAVFLASIVTVAIWDVPVLFPNDPGGGWSDVALLALIALVGLLSVGLKALRTPWWLLLLLAAGSLGWGFSMLAEYRGEHSLWSCEYAGRGRVMIGRTLIRPEVAVENGRERTCTELIEDAAGATQSLWPRQQIVENHERLGWLRTYVVLLISAGLFLLVETGRRIPPRRGR